MERPTEDFRPSEPVTLQLKRKTFINGAMRYPGDVVTVQPQVFAEPDSQKAMRQKNDNVVIVGPDGPRVATVRRIAIAPISPVGVGATRPQGIPSGAVDVGGRIVGPAPEGDVADTHEYVGSNPFTDPDAAALLRAEGDQTMESRETLAALQDEKDAQLKDADALDPDHDGLVTSRIDDLDDMSKAELWALAKTRNVPVDRSQKKPELVLYLRTAFANADAGTTPSRTGEGVEDAATATADAAAKAEG